MHIFFYVVFVLLFYFFHCITLLFNSLLLIDSGGHWGFDERPRQSFAWGPRSLKAALTANIVDICDIIIKHLWKNRVKWIYVDLLLQAKTNSDCRNCGICINWLAWSFFVKADKQRKDSYQKSVVTEEIGG